MKRILMLCLLVAGMATTARAQTVVQMGITTDPDNICNFGLYYSYYSWNGNKFAESYYALLYDFKSNVSYVTVPATVTYDGRTYTVRGISDSEDIGISLNEHSVYSLTFEGDVTVWGNPIKVKPGLAGGLSVLKFNGRSFPFQGDASQYFATTSLNNLHVYLADKNEQQIQQLCQTAPWNQFISVTYSPIHLSLTTNISPCPQTNYNEDVALYCLDGYESFSAAGYDTDRLTLMNYKTPGVYEINKYQSYVLVARYDKQNVDCHYVRQGYDWTLTNNYNTDFDEFFDVTTDMTLDLTFTWKTNSMNFVQLNGAKNISYAIAGSQPMSGSNAEPIWKLTGAMNGDRLTLTLPANDLALEKIVFKHGSTEQTIPAPQPADGNYQVQLTVPSDMFSYIYIYWAEPEPNTHTFLRHGGTGHAYLLYEDNGEEYESPIEIGTTTINLPDFNSDDCTYASFYVDKVKGEKFTAYRDGVEVTGDFEINNYGSQFIYNFDSDDNSESHRQSSVWTLIFEKTNDIIDFADAAVKAICVDNWDTNEDGELSYDEAAAVTSIGEVFRGDTTITSFDELQFFTGLKKIEQYAFDGAKALTSVVLPQRVYAINAFGFRNCAALKHVVLPDSLAWIDSYSFMNTSIKQITLPEKGALMLGYSLFLNTPLRALFIPANLTATIYRDIVANCADLASIAVDEGNRYYDSREGCNAIIKTSTNTLLAGCKNSVIPEGVQAIADHAFYYTGIKKVDLPASLESMEAASFFRCDDLISVVAHMPEPFAITTANIRGLHPNCVLTVPKGKKNAYIQAGWTTEIFKGGIIEEEAPGVPGDINGDGQVTIADVTKLVNIILGKE